MKYKIFLAILIGLLVFITTCGDDDEIDSETPEIDLDFSEAFPTNCDTLYFGDTITFVARFTDNMELGSTTAYSIDIHNNFDHHSHTTEVTECNLDEIKDAVNPFIFIEDFDIPEGLSGYETSLKIILPEGDSDGDYDDGDYHFFISVADKEGWSTQKGLSIKILH